VGPQRAALLARLEIHTARDLLFHIPTGVNDFSDIRPVPRLEPDIEQSVHGRIVDRDIRLLSRGRSLVGILIDCQGHYVRGLWFNQPWMLKKYRDNDHVIYSGKPQRKTGRWEFNNPRVHVLGEDEDPDTVSGVLPRYALTDGLKLDVVRRMTAAAVQDFADLVEDPLPSSFRTHHQLPDLPTALRWIHQPDSVKRWEAGRYRILLDDLLEFQLALALRRQSWTHELTAAAIPVTAKIDARIRRLFSFRFTAGQDRVVSEIAADLSGQHPMHRLLQADVGAGKTAVAAYAMLAAVAAGQQAALMAPTEVLATQHWETFDELLSESRVNRCLLLGGLPAAQRRQLLEEIADGRQQLIIGTQALIQESVRFRSLALVVIDEQHRFGVRQRASFRTDSSSPHVLVMTATPIPRSLCLTQFGDLDISVINELPPGRQRVVTARVVDSVEQQRMWEFIRQQVTNGRQAYVVCPRVEGAADDDDAAAESVFAKLTAGELQGLQVDLLHGRMDRPQRHDIMDRFRERQTQVLVSTTVIEVGVDVPNATLMVVQQAERFGLAQLHQLRGRICRGSHQGYCFLLSTSEADDAIERLTALEKSSDGFELAEIDARLRGPGNILGLQQTGAMPLRYADPVRDLSILQTARRMAEDLVSSGRFDTPEFTALRQIVLARFGSLLDLARTG
jgi:ATP-dependent DNA helicase RecG